MQKLSEVQIRQKAALLRSEVLDLLIFNPDFNGDHHEGETQDDAAMQQAIEWAFREQPEEVKAILYAEIAPKFYTLPHFRESIRKVLG